MANTRVSAADVLSGIAAPPERSFRNRIVGFITLQRMGLCIAVLPFALGVAALAGARLNLQLLPLVIVAFLGGTSDRQLRQQLVILVFFLLTGK
jgi:hypothetical protein